MQILHDIIDWIEDKPKFWQAAIERLIRNNLLSDTDISDIIEICKNENGLSKVEYSDVDFNDLRVLAKNSSSSKKVILTKICNIENINALSQTSELGFSSNGLTMIYGDNGAGKSSYVSILKHICNTRGKIPLINDNLFDSTSRGKDKKAEVEYTSDGVNLNSVRFKNNNISDSTLKGVNVFDNLSANHYIEGEDEIAFIPYGLSIIEKFAISLKKIEDEINKEIQTLDLSKFDFTILQIDENTSAKTFLTNLSSNTKCDELRNHSQYNKDKEERIVELENLITELKGTDPKTKLKNNEGKVERFNILKNKIILLENSLVGESIENIRQVLNDFVVKSETLKATSDKIFSGLPINGIGNDSWKQLWECARKFYNESIEKEVFPDLTANSNCPLCLQDLNIAAKKRFEDFEQFVKHDIQQEYDKALKDYNYITDVLNNLSFSFDEQEPTINELEEIHEGYVEIQKAYLQILAYQKDYLLKQLSDKRALESFSTPKFENNPKNLIESIVNRLNVENEKLENLSIEVELKQHENELLELKNEKKIFDFKPKLAREIFRQKKKYLLTQCVNKCNTRTVTTFSNQLATTYITDSLRQNFKNELNKLGFNNIKIETETKGVKGKQYHYLRLDEPNSTDVVLKDVLSEGEHRCIALSTFFSELSISDHDSPIIFDDPVSSLDHKWRYRIAKRIVEESLKRQVIVFTHDITFLLMIQEYSQKLMTELEIKSLTRKKIETGIVASNPPWDAMPVNKRIGILKNDYQILEKIERTETEEIYRERIKPAYGKLRETWERFIEEVFLNSTIQRFGREIQTKRLEKITDLSIDDYVIVDNNMSKCSTYFLGHDSSGTLIEEMPNSTEFSDDIKILEEFTKTIRNRRK